MLTRYFKSRIAAMGREYDYDVEYMHEFADIDRGSFRKFVFAAPFLTQAHIGPKNAFWAAKLRSTMKADCGSCLRLTIEMARRDGIDQALIRLVVSGKPTDKDALLGVQYADAVLDNDPAIVEIIETIETQWGKKVLANLATAVVAGQFFPLFKRGFGHGNACEPVLRELENAA